MTNYADNVPFTHEELADLALDVIDGRMLVAMKLSQAINGEPTAAWQMSSNFFCISPKTHNLFLASPYMFRTIVNQNVQLTNILTLLERLQAHYRDQVGEPLPALTHVVASIESLQDALMYACRYAVEGVDKVAEELRKPY